MPTAGRCSTTCWLWNSASETMGPLHGVTVSVAALQHPTWLDWRGDGGWWTSLHVYVNDGFDAAARMWATARGHGLPDIAGLPPLGPPAPPYEVTIADVAGPEADFPPTVIAPASMHGPAPPTPPGRSPGRDPSDGNTGRVELRTT